MLHQEERDNDAEVDMHQLTFHRNLTHEREEKSSLKGEQVSSRDSRGNPCPCVVWRAPD